MVSISTAGDLCSSFPQPVDLEAAASVLAGRYLVVKQSQEYFQAIFPGREVSVAADPNKTVQQVMDPVLQEMGLDPLAVTLYVYGARQALSRGTYAGLLKGQKVHVRINNRAGLSPSLTQGSLSSADSRSSLHSSSGNLSQHSRSPRPISQMAGNSSHNNSNNDDGERAVGVSNGCVMAVWPWVRVCVCPFCRCVSAIVLISVLPPQSSSL